MASMPPPPEQPPYGSTGPDTVRAASQVAPPAIALMVLGGLGMAWQLVSIVLNLLGTSLGRFAPPGSDERILEMFSGGFGIVMALVGIVFYGLMLFGALKMKALQSYALAVTAAVIAMLPCSCCCCVGLPIGIWALVVLLDANVKASFTS